MSRLQARVVRLERQRDDGLPILWADLRDGQTLEQAWTRAGIPPERWHRITRPVFAAREWGRQAEFAARQARYNAAWAAYQARRRGG